MGGEGKANRFFGVPLVGSTVRKTLRVILRTILVDDDGNVGVAGTQGDGTLNPLASQTFFPQHGEGQTIAFAGVAVISAQLTAERAHWLFCEDESCWIRASDGVDVAAAGDFPLPVGAIAEFTPAAGAGALQFISVIQRSGAGDLLIGQSEAT